MKYDKKEIFTIPNLLSLFRILLIPVYAIIYMRAEELKDYVIAASVFAVSALTDMVDGIIARKFNMRSRLGIMLDPFADKLTQGVIIICLSIKVIDIYPLLIIFLIKEGFMLIMGMRLLKQKKMLDGALFAGKICTTVLFLSMIVLVVFRDISRAGVHTIVTTCATFMIISLISYARCYFLPSMANHIKDIDDSEFTKTE